MRSHSALTPKEEEVLAILATGLSNLEIAQRLWMTEETVKFHLSNIYRKLGVTSRSAAVGAVKDAEAAELLSLLHLWFERYRGFVAGTPDEMVVRTRKVLEARGVKLMEIPLQ